jgi:endoglucanase
MKHIMVKILVFAISIFFPRTGFAETSPWISPLKGANFFNAKESADRLNAGQDFGLRLVRLTPSKWPAMKTDFLIGDADHYESLPDEDVKSLSKILDAASAHQLKVVLTMLSLPGSRWRQHNGMKFDCRLYEDPKFLEQTAQFWFDLTKTLSGHPALIGIDLINEPFPDLCTNAKLTLNQIYETILSKVRLASPTITVIVESDHFADPQSFGNLLPFNDPNVIYSFHMYEPFNYTNKRLNKGHYRYPGPIPSTSDGSQSDVAMWNRETLQSYLKPIKVWQQRYDIPSNRIFAGEFGCNRTVNGCIDYLKDLTSIFNRNSWHWSFYSFREDMWPGMDYQLGTRPLSSIEWNRIKLGLPLQYPIEQQPIAKILRSAMTQF